MAFTSIRYLPELQKLSPGRFSWDGDLAALDQDLRRMDGELWSIETAAGVEGTLAALFDWRNVPDDLYVAYAAAFTNSQGSLHEHYGDILARGEQSLTGFVSNLKGKLAELRLVPALEREFQGYRFEIAPLANQPIWDVRGIGPEGTEEILVQVKAGAEGYASAVAGRMQESPDVVFAISHEIRDTILGRYPELSSQIIDLKFSGMEATRDVEEGLALVASNFGIDLPDSIGDWLPYVGELVLAVRLVLDVQSVRREFADVQMSERKRLHALRALVLLTRFATSGALVSAGGAIGTLVGPGWGNAVGAVIGAGGASAAHRKLRPHVLELAMRVVDVTDDDLFYFRNKRQIDELAWSMRATG